MTYYFEHYFSVQDKIICLSAIWKEVCYSVFFLSPVKNNFSNICVFTYNYTCTFNHLHINFKAENHSLQFLFNSSICIYKKSFFFVMALKFLTTPSSDILNVSQCFEGTLPALSQHSSFNLCSKYYVLLC